MESRRPSIGVLASFAGPAGVVTGAWGGAVYAAFATGPLSSDGVASLGSMQIGAVFGLAIGGGAGAVVGGVASAVLALTWWARWPRALIAVAGVIASTVAMIGLTVGSAALLAIGIEPRPPVFDAQTIAGVVLGSVLAAAGVVTVVALGEVRPAPPGWAVRLG